MQRGEESALVRQVAAGDRVAFRTLVDAHQRALSGYALRMLSDRDSADDIVQETFLRLWSRAGSFDGNAARLTTWLHNIAHNLCIDFFRRNARLSFGAEQDAEVSSAPGPEAGHESCERSAQVRRAISELPERQRSALVLCHYQGLSNRDAAAVLDVSVDALESLLARARRQLKKQLESLYGS
jgi:RNA polymerase sigma-70 factor (ECF subfamily)